MLQTMQASRDAVLLECSVLKGVLDLVLVLPRMSCLPCKTCLVEIV